MAAAAAAAAASPAPRIGSSQLARQRARGCNHHHHHHHDNNKHHTSMKHNHKQLIMIARGRAAANLNSAAGRKSEKSTAVLAPGPGGARSVFFSVWRARHEKKPACACAVRFSFGAAACADTWHLRAPCPHSSQTTSSP